MAYHGKPGSGKATAWLYVVTFLAQAEFLLPAGAQTIQWTRQFGTAQDDEAKGVAADSTGVYVAGVVEGALPGQTGAGQRDAFVRKYDVNGNELWTRQFGTPKYDEAEGVAVDGSFVYVIGSSEDALPGQTSSGAFVRKYDINGTELWTRQFSTGGMTVWAVAANSTAVYVVGEVRGTLPGQTSAGKDDAFVRKYDTNGNELWTRQFGSKEGDSANGVAVDSTGVYVVGDVGDALPEWSHRGESNTDAFVRKYDVNGNELWTRQFGTAGFRHKALWLGDEARRVAADATGVYVTGVVEGALPGQTSARLRDVFVRKYDANGNVLWTHQFGTNKDDVSTGVAVDTTGVYVVGDIEDLRLSDAFVREYDANGNELWSRKIGTNKDGAMGVAVDATGIYIAGSTKGVLQGQTSAGLNDAFVIKLTPGSVPPPVRK